MNRRHRPGPNLEPGRVALGSEPISDQPAIVAGKTGKEVAELSLLLNRIGQRLGRGEYPNFRNANGAYMKMMNFRRLDPRFTGTVWVGLTRATAWRRSSGGTSPPTRHGWSRWPWLSEATWKN